MAQRFGPFVIPLAAAVMWAVATAAAPAAAAPGLRSTSTSVATSISTSISARAAGVPCPRVRVKPNPPAPASPLPVHDPSKPPVGGGGLATDGLAVPEDTPALPKTISASSWVVADLDNGDVLGACAPHRAGAPASLEKLLLAATVMPKLNAKDVITVTAEDMNYEPGSSAVGLLVGGKYTVETLWFGLMLNSGNDAANVLARLGGGARGIAGTVADMNATARHLGALDTVAVTPSGLDGPGQVTSAYDLALIARADFARADFRSFNGAKSAQIPAQPPRDKKGFQIQNDNQLLFDYPGAIGGKTGFTDIARHTYVGAATRDGRTLVVTMLGGEHQPMRLWQQGAALLDWGFSVGGSAFGGEAVGRLVDPGETDPKPVPAVPTIAAGAPAGSGAGGGPGLTGRDIGLASAGVAAAVVLVWVGLLLLAWRRRLGRTQPELATNSDERVPAGPDILDA